MANAAAAITPSDIKAESRGRPIRATPILAFIEAAC
jgi:hypothetical protein